MMRIRLAFSLATLLITCLGLFGFPDPVQGQQARTAYRIGVMVNICSRGPENIRLWDAFLAGLREFGYIEGNNLLIECLSSEGHAERFPKLAAELVNLKVDLIVVNTTPAAVAAKAATSTIPILITAAHDPVGAGLAASLRRPGGNVTGLASLVPELSAKRLELLKVVVPRASHVAVLWNSANPANVLALHETEKATGDLKIVLQRHEVRAPEDFPVTFAAIRQQRPDALLVLGDALTMQRRQDITQFALQARLPTSFESRESVVAGGLMSYGPDYPEMFRRAAFYVDRLLNGANPAELPFEQASKFQLVINMKTARSLGLTVPQELLQQAYELIE
jgi:putative ABC transport system substrate-binding protein